MVFNALIIEVNGDPKGGPGALQTDPALTEFPAEAEVAGCCYGAVSAEERIAACESDCGRAACNRILESLRAQVEADDPSDGGCDDLPAGAARDLCQDRVKTSLEAWIPQIEANYDQCVAAAIANDDPNAPYTDIQEPFAADRKLELADSDCNHNFAGCLFDAELRPFCEIDSTAVGDPCSAAANPEDEAADGGSADTTGGEGGGVDSFGDVAALVSCSPQTTCQVDSELITNIEMNFGALYEDDVTLDLVTSSTACGPGAKIAGLDTGEVTKGLADEFDFRNGDILNEINGTVLDSWEDAMNVLNSLPTASTITIKRKRLVGTRCATANYTLTVTP